MERKKPKRPKKCRGSVAEALGKTTDQKAASQAQVALESKPGKAGVTITMLAEVTTDPYMYTIPEPSQAAQAAAPPKAWD